MAIKTGDRGASVRTLQNQLRAQGFNPGTADGVFGAKTAAAVRRFQEAKGLEVDAKVGRNTQRALTAERNRDSFTPSGRTPRATTPRPAGTTTPRRTAGTTPRRTAATTTPRNTTAARSTTATRTADARRPGERPFQAMKRFAESRGFTVTSTTGGRHTGRAHREGRAVDVRTRDHTRAQGDALIREARAAGYTVIDERRHPASSAWSGPHIHIQRG